MSEFNQDELEAPSWLNEPFFEKVLRKCENNDSVVLKDMKITPGSGKGDHYASVMFRVAVTYDTSKSKGITKSLIVKTMPDSDGHKKNLLRESYIFETETSMYFKTIPKLEAELRKIGDETLLGAKCLYYDLEPKKIIIFEDIVPKGYTTIRNRMASMDEAKMALLKLAKWHAVSYKLAAEGDSSVTGYREGFLNMKNVEAEPFMAGLDLFIDKARTDDDLKPYIPKLEIIQKDLVKRCISSFNTYRLNTIKSVFVLCHGDFHIKNMMFKRNDKGELEDVMLVDFQMCYFGPAILDLIYGIYMLFSEDLRTNHRNELMYYYSSNFNETLRKLKFKGEYPNIADFFIDILQHRHWEIFLITNFLPMWYEILADRLEVDEVMTSEDARRRVYDNPDYLKEVKRLLRWMLSKGYLEYN